MSADIYLNQQYTFVHHLESFFIISMFIIIGLCVLLKLSDMSKHKKYNYTIIVIVLSLLQIGFGVYISEESSIIRAIGDSVIKMEKVGVVASDYAAANRKEPLTLKDLGPEFADLEDAWGYPLVIEPEMRRIRSVGLEHHVIFKGYSADVATIGY